MIYLKNELDCRRKGRAASCVELFYLLQIEMEHFQAVLPQAKMLINFILYTLLELDVNTLKMRGLNLDISLG